MTRLDAGKTILIKLEDIYIWTDNPRIKTVYEEVDAISLIFTVIGETKMINLMKDIVTYGLQINEAIVVVEKNHQYYVYDGNRRVTAVKTLMFPELIADVKIRKKVENYRDSLTDFSFENIEVKVVSEEVALELILRKHGNNSDGTSMIPWSTWQRDKTLHKLNKSPEYAHAYYAVVDLGYSSASEIKEKYGIQYTDLERILSPEPVAEYLKNLKSEKSIEEYRNYLEKYLLKISFVKEDENRPISRIYNKSENVIETLDSFKNELQLNDEKIVTFIPSPSRKPTISPISGNIHSVVPHGSTIKNSTSTEDLLIFDFQKIGIDIGIYSNSVFLEMQGIKQRDLNRFLISFGSLVRILIDTAICDFLKKCDINPNGKFPVDIPKVMAELKNADFDHVEPLSIKGIKDFVETQMLLKNAEDKYINGPFINKLHDIVHNGKGSVLELKQDLNNYVIPLIIAMSNHIGNRNQENRM